MKKFASLVLTVVLLATMLTVFAVPASAAEILNVQENMNISGEQTYSFLAVNGKIDFEVAVGSWIPCNLTIESGASVKCDEDFNINNGCTVTIKSGASVTCDRVQMSGGSTVIIENGASVTCNSFQLNNGSSVTIEDGASVTCDGFYAYDGSTVIIENGASLTCERLEVSSLGTEKSTMTVERGAVVTVNETLEVLDILNLGGVLTGKGELSANTAFNMNFELLSGGALDFEVTDDTDVADVKDFVTILQKYAPNAKYEQTADGTFRVTAHNHIYNGTCCGAEYAAGVGGEGSILSEGSLTVICSVGCLAVGFLAAMFIFKKKKKPAVAGGTENKGEE